MLLNQRPSKFPSLYGLIDIWQQTRRVDTTKYLRTSLDLHDLNMRYREPWRGYHGIDHIADGLYELLQHLGSIDDEKREGALVRAWCYHDAYYAPGCPQNEYFSYLLSIRSMPSRFPERMIEVMADHIMATREHQLPENAHYPEDTALLIDIDLKRLAGTPEEFMHDHELIVQEFCEAYPEPAVLRGRREWAQTFLKRERIYLTPFYAHLEETARRNLTNLVRVLS